MAVERFTLASLLAMDDGRIREAWEQAVKRARDDCLDRPAVDKARKITLVASFEPAHSSQGNLESVNVTFDIGENFPKRTSATYNMASGRGGLFYNEVSPDDIRQQTLDDLGPREVHSAQ